jgi:L-2-hydroxyglutarate oxidase LhgO
MIFPASSAAPPNSTGSTAISSAPINERMASECVVIGAGVIGLAVAREMALAGIETILLEKEKSIGTGISSRNSEVIHAGIYYPQGSLKARFCVEGKARLYDYCRTRHVPYKPIGKVIAANTAQMAKLNAIAQTARANGVTDLQPLSRTELQAMEPEVAADAGLFSPSTGIVDSHTLMATLLGDFEQAGGALALDAPVLDGTIEKDGIALAIGGAEPCTITTRFLINSAGLDAADFLHKLRGFPPSHIPPMYYAKGNYFSLSARSPFTHLVYPVPEEGGLGIHATLDMAGQCRFGPDVEWVEAPDHYAVDSGRAARFYAAIRSYWPGLQDGALAPSYAGMRPKLNPAGQGNADFVVQDQKIHGVKGVINLLGMESPGLTAALAVAAHTKDLLLS